MNNGINRCIVGEKEKKTILEGELTMSAISCQMSLEGTQALAGNNCAFGAQG